MYSYCWTIQYWYRGYLKLNKNLENFENYNIIRVIVLDFVYYGKDLIHKF